MSDSETTDTTDTTEAEEEVAAEAADGDDEDSSLADAVAEKAIDLGVEPEEHAHPNPSAYVGIAVILAIATAVEIALYYLEEDLSPALITVSLLVLMVIKFFLVALWFMHLRFEARIFRHLFYGGAVLAVVAYSVVLAASHVFPVGL